MGDGTKIAVIGGGSAVWTRNLIADLAGDRHFDGSSVSLMDIDLPKAELLSAWCRRFLEEKAVPVDVVATADRQEAIEGADVVIIQISYGGNRARRLEMDIPEKFGIYQTIGDSIGPGGLIRAIRHAPKIVEIADTVASHAPDALVVELTNPMAQLCRVLDLHGKTNHFGYCHGAYETLEILASTLKVNHRRLDIRAWGVNHFLFMRGFTIDGEDAWRLIDENYDRLKKLHPAVFDFWEIFGEYPINNDRHPVEFVPYYLREEFDGGKRWGVSRILEDFLLDNYDELVRLLEAQLASDKPLTHSTRSDRLVDAVRAWLFGPEAVVHLNVANVSDSSERRPVPGLSEVAVIEAPCVIGPGRIEPELLDPPLTTATLSLLQRVADVEELTAQAAFERDGEKALQALALDPLIPSTDLARSLLSAMVESQKEWFDDWENFLPTRR